MNRVFLSSFILVVVPFLQLEMRIIFLLLFLERTEDFFSQSEERRGYKIGANEQGAIRDYQLLDRP